MSVTVAWPESEGMPGMCIELLGNRYWIRPMSDDSDRINSASIANTSNHTLVMDDDELSNLLFAYARRKGIIK